MIVDGRIKVKRDGPRGWHWIDASHYDPARHELHHDEPTVQQTQPTPMPTPARRGRKSTTLTEATNGDR